MEKFYRWIIEHSRIVMVIFAVAFVICGICSQFVAVDYDMNDYLPEDSPSTVALDIMDEEFSGGVPNARVMIKDVTIPEALEYKEKIKAVDGVTDVTWLDDAESTNIPLEAMDKDTVESYYVDGNALLSVTIEEDKTVQAVSDIREIIGDDNPMTGSAVSTAAATTSTVSEIRKISAVAVLFVILVLILTTDSWFEPVIVMVGLGVSIVINSGTNLMFGEISFVTNAAGSILQMAVSMDYSVFLIHRFTECRKEYTDEREAMVKALTMSTSSILSSGLTTVIGFLALCLMRFQIGPDLGRALAKGIAISLITVFVFMPCLIIATYKWLDKLQHRPFVPSFNKFGRAVRKIMIPAMLIFVATIVPSYLASNSNSFYYGASHIFNEKTKTGADTASVEEVFGKSDTYVLIVPKEDKATQKALSDKLHDIPQVKSIISYVDTVGMEIPESYLDEDIYSKLCSDEHTRMVLTVDAEYEGDETFDLIEEIRDTAEEYYPGEWYLAGEGVSTYDLMDTVTSDMVKVNLVAIGAVFVVLLLTLRSVVLPVILVLAIETAIWINLAIPYFTGQRIFYIAYLIISSIQLGATVDYAILMTERYKEYRLTCNKKDSIVNTLSAVTVSILTSGSALTVVGFLLSAISTHGLLAQLGFFLGRGTLCSLVIVLFALPGLLYVFDGTFVKKDKGNRKNRKDRKNRNNIESMEEA